VALVDEPVDAGVRKRAAERGGGRHRVNQIAKRPEPDNQ